MASRRPIIVRKHTRRQNNKKVNVVRHERQILNKNMTNKDLLNSDFDGDGVKNKNDCRPFDAKRQDYGLTDEQQKVIEEELGSEIVKNYDDARGNIIELENGEEWLIFDNYDEAEEKCVEYVKEQLEDEPELFIQEWLNQFIYVTDTDRRIIANEEVDNRLSDMNDDEIVEQAGMKNEWDEIEDKINNSSEDESELEIEKLTQQQKEIEKKAREKIEDEIYNEWYEGLKDPIDFLVDEQGICSKEDLLKQSFISIDTDEASKDAVDTDGVAHFFATYDGDETDFKDGSVGYRVN